MRSRIGAIASARRGVAATPLVYDRHARFEGGTSPWDADQASFAGTNALAPARITSSPTPPRGIYAVKCDAGASSSNRYSRMIFNNDSPGWIEGTDRWISCWMYLPSGFAASITAQCDLMRLDSYVNTSSGTNGTAQEHLAVNFKSDGVAKVSAQLNSVYTDIITGFTLPEGQWFWLAMRAKLSQTAGVAATELWIDGTQVGSSTAANCGPDTRTGANFYNRARYGAVSCPPAQTASQVVYLDDLAVSNVRPTAVAEPPTVYAGAGQNGGGGTTTTVAYPATITADDMLLLTIVGSAITPSTADMNTPSGWAEVGSVLSAGGGPGTSQRTFWKVATGSESGTLAISGMSSGVSKALRMYCIAGTFTGVEGYSTSATGGSTSSTVNDADATTTGSNRVAVQQVSWRVAATIGDFAGETGGDWTESVAEYAFTGFSGGCQMQAATIPSAGTIGGGQATLSAASHWVVQGFAVY